MFDLFFQKGGFNERMGIMIRSLIIVITIISKLTYYNKQQPLVVRRELSSLNIPI